MGRWTYADPSWARIAALVPVVKACAEAGDQVTHKVLRNAVQELADSVKAVVRRLGLSGKSEIPLFVTASLLLHVKFDGLLLSFTCLFLISQVQGEH